MSSGVSLPARPFSESSARIAGNFVDVFAVRVANDRNYKAVRRIGRKTNVEVLLQDHVLTRRIQRGIELRKILQRSNAGADDESQRRELDARLRRPFLQFAAQVFEVGDVGFVELGDMREVDPARMQTRTRDLLDARQRLGFYWAEQREIDLDDEGDLASYVCFFTDISERKASEQRIHRLAYYDALTHLPNRTLFQDRLHTALQQAERQKSWVVLMFLDLDRFKPINDSLGHAAGDRMLKEMATRLLACVADDDTVARMGGDEFTLLLATAGHPGNGLEPGHQCRRADSHQPGDAVRARRPRVLRHRQYRHRPEPAGWQRAQPADEKRRHRDVPRQGTRARTTSSSTRPT